MPGKAQSTVDKAYQSSQRGGLRGVCSIVRLVCGEYETVYSQKGEEGRV